MRFGIISDVHANELALEACLAAVSRQGVDRLIFLGDIVGYGPDPEAVTQRVAALAGQGAICLKGNHDAASTGSPTFMNDVAQAAIDWTRPRLSEGSRRFLAQLPMQQEVDDLLFVHAEASQPESWIYVTDAATALRSIQAVPARITFCGHVHRPQLYGLTATGKVVTHTPRSEVPLPLPAQRRWLAVAGAAGQPRDGNPAASFMTYDSESRSLTYHRAAYDCDMAAQRLRDVGLPDELGRRLVEGV